MGYINQCPECKGRKVDRLESIRFERTIITCIVLSVLSFILGILVLLIGEAGHCVVFLINMFLFGGVGIALRYFKTIAYHCLNCGLKWN